MEIREIDIDTLCDNCKEELNKPVITNPFSAEAIKEWGEYNQRLERECYVTGGCLVLDLGTQPYEIELSRIDTPEKILIWSCHLCEKTWMRRDLMRRFIEVASEQIGFDPFAGV
jgi:hypothetical protein